MKRLAFAPLIALAMITVTTTRPAGAQTQPESGPTLEVHLRTLKRAGGVSMRASGDSAFVPGTPVNWFLTAGSSNPTEMTVCGGGVGEVGTLGDKLSRNAFVWDIRMLPSKYENGTATFDLEWARYQADGAARPSAEGKTTLTLREGDRQPIDFVRGAPGSRNCADEAAVVEIGTGYKESRQFAQAVLQYDLWLKHQTAAGETLTRRFTTMGAQGADVDFVFAPLQFAIRQPAAAGTAYDVVTSVQGTIKGRLMPNGRIALVLNTSRRDGLGAPGGGPAGGSGNAGRKLIEVASDEVVEIELPAPGGTSIRRTVAKGAAANGRVVVDNAQFFQGQRTSLVLQVKPVRQ